MKNIKTPGSFFIIVMISAFFLSGCASYHTRTEEDVHTISDIDTTTVSFVQNAPGNRDNGIVYPSSRSIRSQRYLLQRDSIVTRSYPDFVRLGLFESIGIIGGDPDYSIGTGLFGVFADQKNLVETFRGEKGNIFSGGIYRIGIGEWRLRWFRDAADWTLGYHLFEAIVPDARGEKSLTSMLTPYIRKRFYLRRKIPYIAITPAIGFGWWPSQYINTSVSLDVGSIGGLNMRAYLGLATGINLAGSPVIENNEYASSSLTSTIPYAGLGISVLDFLNLVPETLKEWKDYDHSSWNVGLIEIALLSSGSDISIFADLDSDGRPMSSPFLTGWMLRLANAYVALPILDNRLYAGTSLINMMVFGQSEWGFGILPIRLGYWLTILPDELTADPFVEYNYYPSAFFQVGSRINFRINQMLNINFLFGLASGNTTREVFNILENSSTGTPGRISTIYFGLGFSLSDRIFFPDELRYNK